MLRSLSLLSLAAMAVAAPAAAQTVPPFANAGFTPNTQAIGALIDGQAANPNFAPISGALGTAVTPQAANNFLLGFTPASRAMVPEVTFNSVEWQDDAVRKYLRDLRAGGVGNKNPNRTTGSDRPIGFWLEGSGRSGSFDGGYDRQRTTYGAQSIIGGVDVRFAPKILLGLYGGYDNNDVHLTSQSPTSTLGRWFAGAYTTLSVGPLFVDAHGFYGRSNNSLSSTNGFLLGAPGGNSGAFGADNQNYGASATAGLAFKYLGIEVSPYGGARWTRVDTDAATLDGVATAGSLQTNQFSVNSLQSIAGLQLGGDIQMGTAHIRPTIRGEYRHEFDNSPYTITGGLYDGTGAVIPTAFRTGKFDRNYADVGAGFTISDVLPFAIIIEYDGKFASDQRSNGITGGVRFSF